MEPLLVALASLSQIVLINIVLSGDNALVIALAARHLPEPQRRAAMLWGGAAAVALRLVLTFAVAYVLLLPGLRLLGAVLLLWIACKLVQEGEEASGRGGPAPTSLRTAILRIAVADLVMSLDNVVAIAGVSGSDPILLTVGLILSIAAILAFSRVILAMMHRFRWIMYAGAGLLALTAAGMAVHDLEAVRDVAHRAGPSLHSPHWIDWGLRASAVAMCVTARRWWPKRIAVGVS